MMRSRCPLDTPTWVDGTDCAFALAFLELLEVVVSCIYWDLGQGWVVEVYSFNTRWFEMVCRHLWCCSWVITLIALSLVVNMCDKIDLLNILFYMICIYVLDVLWQNVSSNNSNRTLPDVLTIFYYVLEKHLVCAATFLTCCKSDVSVVIFASCAVVGGEGSNSVTNITHHKLKSIFYCYC